MSRPTQTIIVCLLFGMLGVIASPVFSKFRLEEAVDLELLFRLRGNIEPPSDVIIVSMDRESADNLGQPDKPDEWDRSLHASLTEYLAKKGASVIAFDLMFNKAGNTDDDNEFANAINSAGNVVLCQELPKKEKPSIDNKGNIIIYEPKPIMSLFGKSALALAPFPLPKTPTDYSPKLSRYWIFKQDAGNIPSLPVVAFQIFAFEVYDEFIQLLKKAGAIQVETLFSDKETIKNYKRVTENIISLRDYFRENKAVGKKITEKINSSKLLSGDPKKKQILMSLIEIFQGPDDRYLNFYGEPGTIKSIPYYQLKPHAESDIQEMEFDFKGKAVFIGYSDNQENNKKDGFYTVYSKDGIDISGVEIAATVFGNLLENRPLRPVPVLVQYAIIFLWGSLIGIICIKSTPVLSAVSLTCLGLFYMGIAFFQFKINSNWYPITVPLFFQGPVAYFCCILWKFFKLNKERHNIRKAFKYYLPEQVVEKLAINIGHIKAGTQIVYGTCMFSDGEQYTSLSENMDPRELSDFMNSYYESVFTPVKKYGGIVSDVIGDSMLSIWATTQPDTNSRRKACSAALAIANAVEHFKKDAKTIHLPTRIGLHSGYISIGSIGAIDHYEYRPVGDIVNTASRIENLNKFLGTRILISKEVLHEVYDFLTRKVGEFIFRGKSNPVVIYELKSHKEESNEHQRDLCGFFTKGLAAYYRRSWEEAIIDLRKVLLINRDDGPSHYYLAKCVDYRKNPPGDNWNGVINLESK